MISSFEPAFRRWTACHVTQIADFIGQIDGLGLGCQVWRVIDLGLLANVFLQGLVIGDLLNDCTDRWPKRLSQFLCRSFSVLDRVMQ